MNRAEVIDTRACPKCHAEAGQPCTGRGGAKRRTAHTERWPIPWPPRTVGAAESYRAPFGRPIPPPPAPLTPAERERFARLAREARDRLRES